MRHTVPGGAQLRAPARQDIVDRAHRSLLAVVLASLFAGPAVQDRDQPAGHDQPRPARILPVEMINGYRAFLNTPPSSGKQTLSVPDADGLFLYEQTAGSGAPLSPASVLAHHLQLLGPDPANWTTAPVSP